MYNKLRAIGMACATAVLASGLLSAAALTAQAAPPTPASGKKQITYVVAPHPDDVYEAWSLVEFSPDNYPVFITFTKGEATTYCTGRSVAVDGYGSNTATRWEAGCKNARMASLNSFLDKRASNDGALEPLSAMTSRTITTPASSATDGGAPTASGMTRCTANRAESACSVSTGKPVPWNGNDNTTPTSWTLRSGSNSARAEFDLGDGNLTDDEVKWAIAAVRAQRGINISTLPERNIIGASYSNLYNTAASIYAHHDHRAVSETLYNGRFGINTLGATYLTDPDANAFYSHPYPGGNGASNREITSYAYDMRGNYSSGGYFQKSFGWLTGTVGSSTGSWEECTNTSVNPQKALIFCQQQAFWLRP